MSSLKIIFLGTPDFATASLAELVENSYHITAVITAPDKPAGRGQKLQESDVKKYAIQHGLTVLQPTNLKDPVFIEELKALDADLQIVVAFRMLPEAVWNMPPLGTFNLHGSLLPQYRGAAPIHWAVMNGDKETGVTTFMLKHEIDTGSIIYQEKTPIGPDETTGEVYEKLMNVGASLVLKTVKAIESGHYPQTEQDSLTANSLKHAPKIFKDDCKINWNRPIETIHNFIRGLSPIPTAFTTLKNPLGEEWSMKIFKAKMELTPNLHLTGTLLTDHKTFLKVSVSDGYIRIVDMQLAGKKRMLVDEFLRGFKVNEEFIVY